MRHTLPGVRVAWLTGGVVVTLVLLEGVARVVERTGRFSFDRQEGAQRQSLSVEETLGPAVEFAAPGLIERDDQLGYRLRAGATTDLYHVNEQGFRGRPVAVPKPRATFRVLALGGSTTFGWGVSEADTYPALLEELLQDRCTPHLADRIEVINAGVPGYVSLQVARGLQETWQVFEADTILVMTGFNDLFIVPMSAEKGEALVVQPGLVRSRGAVLLAAWSAWLTRHSTMARWGISWIRGQRRGTHPVRRRAFDPTGSSGAAGMARMLRQNFEMIAALANARGAQLVVLTYPGVSNPSLAQALKQWSESGRSQVIGLAGFDTMVEVVRQWATNQGVPYINLRETFAIENRGTQAYLADGMHFSPEGNAAIARTIYSRIFQSHCEHAERDTGT